MSQETQQQQAVTGNQVGNELMLSQCFRKAATQMEKRLDVFQILLLNWLLILHYMFLSLLIKTISPCINSFISWLCILLHWPMSLMPAKCHSDYHTLQHTLNQWPFQALLYKLKIVLFPYIAVLYKLLNVYMLLGAGYQSCSLEQERPPQDSGWLRVRRRGCSHQQVNRKSQG